MLRKEMTYKNFNDETVTESFYFNFTDKELVDLELSETGGMTAVIKTLSTEKDPNKIWDIFCRIVDWSYGRKTAEGKFPKSKEILDDFKSTQAYSDLIMELIQDSKEGAKFINGLVSAERLAAAQARAAEKQGQPTLPGPIQFSEPDGIVVTNDKPDIEYYPTRVAPSEMSKEELLAEVSRLKGLS